jgi:hypothetical protein
MEQKRERERKNTRLSYFPCFSSFTALTKGTTKRQPKSARERMEKKNIVAARNCSWSRANHRPEAYGKFIFIFYFFRQNDDLMRCD